MNTEILEKVRNELIAVEEKDCCKYAFLSGAIRGAGELVFTKKGFALEFRHPDCNFVNKLKDIINALYNENFSVDKTNIDMGDYRGRSDYFVLNIPSEISGGLLEKCGIVANLTELQDDIPVALIKKQCCKQAYLRGLYLSCGHLGLPEDGNAWEVKKTKGGYALTFYLNSDMVLEPIKKLLAKCAMIDGEKILVRDNTSVIYIKTAEAVSSVMAAVGSSAGVLALEDIILKRQLKNDLNRKQNFDMANINKQLSAGLKQCEDIELIDKNTGIGALSEQLAAICRVRLENPEANLEELGRLFNPPLTKSCVNHRLRKIAEIADTYRK